MDLDDCPLWDVIALRIGRALAGRQGADLARLPIEEKVKIMLETQRMMNQIREMHGLPLRPVWPYRRPRDRSE